MIATNTYGYYQEIIKYLDTLLLRLIIGTCTQATKRYTRRDVILCSVAFIVYNPIRHFTDEKKYGGVSARSPFCDCFSGGNIACFQTVKDQVRVC